MGYLHISSFKSTYLYMTVFELIRKIKVTLAVTDCAQFYLVSSENEKYIISFIRQIQLQKPYMGCIKKRQHQDLIISIVPENFLIGNKLLLSPLEKVGHPAVIISAIQKLKIPKVKCAQACTHIHFMYVYMYMYVFRLQSL